MKSIKVKNFGPIKIGFNGSLKIYPAIREAALSANAIMHRDYFDRTSDVLIECYKTRIVIYNPGGLVRWMKPGEFGKISKTRNIIIASLLSRSPQCYVERMGTGIERMRLSMRERELQEPLFTYYDHSFYVTFFNNQYNNVTDRQKKILLLIKAGNSISTGEIAEKMNLSKRTILRDIDNLKKLGLLKRIGSEKSGYWQIHVIEIDKQRHDNE